VIYPENFEQKIGFDRIRGMVAEACTNPLGVDLSASMSFSSDFSIVEEQLRQTEEMRNLLTDEAGYPSTDIVDITNELLRVRTPGTFIEPEFLSDLRHTMQIIADIIKYFNDIRQQKYPRLAAIAFSAPVDSAILIALNKIVDEKGGIRDGASAELARIRKEIKKKESSVRGKLEATLSEARKAGFTPENSEPTLRNGRLVIPVLSNFKRRIRGFVHDESATGQTAFIEPEAVFETNNQIRELETEEVREIIRILTIFTNLIRPDLPGLRDALHMTARLDFIKARARVALKLGASLPVLNNKPVIDWLDAVHPLLYLTLAAQHKPVEPLSVKLSGQERILIISGPNAGGKSVCLKTVGLLQYMLQCGLLVPMKHTSETGIFTKIFIDIGDEQSLDNDLSTYSSHLMAMKHFVENADGETLFLSDEMGTGTEPRLGGAIAEAIIEKLSSAESIGLITTHYASLKLLGGRIPGVINGAMLFDTRRMQPLFRLLTGMPGSSFTYEIARKIGFPSYIIESATAKSGNDQLSFEEQLQQLDVEKQELDKKRRQIEIADNLLSETLQKYAKLHTEIETARGEILKKAKREALDILEGANKLIENTVSEIKSVKADKKQTIDIRKKLHQQIEQIRQAPEVPPSSLPVMPKALQKTEKPAVEKPLEVGDFVKIGVQDTIGQIAAIKGNDATVMFDQVKLHTELRKLRRVNESEQKKVRAKASRNLLNTDLERSMASFQLTLDVRGKSGEEAVQSVLHFIDEAMLLHIREVRILHGKGNGILRSMVRDYLRTRSDVRSWRDDNPDQAGAGVTMVTLK